MYLQLKNYNNANEILYVLKSIKDQVGQPISKLGVQKLLYLAAALAPIKNIVLSLVKFITEKRGPYSSNIQNVLDHLAAYGLIEISDFHISKNKKSALAFYQITDGGINAVDSLVKYKREEEIFWWINIITQLTILYTSEEQLKELTEFSGLDKIVKLVYQDPTFKSTSKKQGRYAWIDLTKDDGLTYDLIKIAKEFLEGTKSKNFKDEKRKAEYILLSFFEFLYVKYLDEVNG